MLEWSFRLFPIFSSAPQFYGHCFQVPVLRGAVQTTDLLVIAQAQMGQDK